MKITLESKIIKVLYMAAKIKDKEVGLICNKKLRYYGPKKGYLMCIKCYPNQPERSKREDFDCNHECKYIHLSHGHKDGCTNPDTRGECKTKMRCSEHCGNTVRDK